MNEELHRRRRRDISINKPSRTGATSFRLCTPVVAEKVRSSLARRAVIIKHHPLPS